MRQAVALVLLVFLAALDAPRVYAQSPPNSEPWEKMLWELKRKFGDLQDQSRWVHLLPIARTVQWDSAAGEEDLWDVGDTIPDQTLLYSKGNARFSLNWQVFLNSIDLGKSAAPNPARNAAEKTWQTAVADRNRLENELSRGWVQFQKNEISNKVPERFRRPWYVWYNSEAGPALAVANKKVSDALGDYAQYLDPKDPINLAVSDVLRYLSAGQLSPGNDPNRLSSLRNPYRLSNGPKGVETFLSDGEQNRKAASWPFELLIDSKSERDRRETVNISGSASFAGFISVSGSGNRRSINTTNEKFKLHVKFRNLERMEIRPAGGWFDTGLLDQLRNGPFKPNINRDRFFGKTGTLRFRPVEVILAYQPEIEATFFHEDYKFMETTLSTGGGFSVGPFSFGSNNSYTVTETARDENTVSFKVTSVGTRPQLIAVVSKIEQ